MDADRQYEFQLLELDFSYNSAKSTSAYSIVSNKEHRNMDMSSNLTSPAHQQLQRMLTILEFGGSVPQHVLEALTTPVTSSQSQRQPQGADGT